jgi:hypothetical protein
MKKRVTTVMRIAIFLMGIAVVSVCGILLPEGAREEAISNPHAGPVWPYLLGAWIIAVPIFIALYQTFLLTRFIDDDKAFTTKSVKALQIIKNCALIFAALVVMGAIAVVFFAKLADPHEDVAPVGPIGFIFVSISIIIATFVAVLKKLLTQAIDMKSENDLTV